MRGLWIIPLVITILSIPVYFLKAEEDYIYVEQRDPVTGKTEIKKMKNIFTEKIPVRRGQQVFEETVKGAGEGAATGIAGSIITSGGTTAPATAGVGAAIGAAKGAYKGATEPTEYSTFDKTKINQGLRDKWTQEGLQPGQPGYLSEEQKRQAQEQAGQQTQK